MHTFGPIHSPLVEPDTWESVGAELRQGGAVLPNVTASPASDRPYWQQIVAWAVIGLAGLRLWSLDY